MSIYQTNNSGPNWTSPINSQVLRAGGGENSHQLILPPGRTPVALFLLGERNYFSMRFVFAGSNAKVERVIGRIMTTVRHKRDNRWPRFVYCSQIDLPDGLWASPSPWSSRELSRKFAVWFLRIPRFAPRVPDYEFDTETTKWQTFNITVFGIVATFNLTRFVKAYCHQLTLVLPEVYW